MNAPTLATTLTTARDPFNVAGDDRGYRGQKLRPLTALRAFGRLVRDKEDTRQVFEIMSALTGRSTPRGYGRLTRVAGSVAYTRDELARKFADPQWLAQFAPGTVGAAYREFMTRENLSVEALRRDNAAVTPMVEAEHVFAWYARRMRDIHDVWHVLTGFGRDALGEACVVAFSYAQTGNKGFGFIGLMGALRLSARGYPIKRAVWQAYRMGRRAAWLPAQDYAALFAVPLEEARSCLRITTPTDYLSIPQEVRGGLTFAH